MDYQLDPQETALQQDVGAFCRERIAPRAFMLDRCSRQDAPRLMAENIRMLGGAGWLEKGHGSSSLDMAVLRAGRIGDVIPQDGRLVAGDQFAPMRINVGDVRRIGRNPGEKVR